MNHVTIVISDVLFAVGPSVSLISVNVFDMFFTLFFFFYYANMFKNLIKETSCCSLIFGSRNL